MVQLFKDIKLSKTGSQLLSIAVFMISLQLTAQSSWQVLELPYSAQSLGRANGAAILPNAELTSNPAALQADELILGIGSLVYPEDIQSHQLFGTMPLKSGVFGVSLVLMDFGSLQDGVTLETFSARDTWLRLAYKDTLWESISWGISFGFGESRIENYTSSAYQINAGIKTRLLNERLGIGLSMENMGNVIDGYDTGKEDLPEALRYSLYYSPEHLPAVISLDYLSKDSSESQLLGVMEFNLKNGIRFCFSMDDNSNDLSEGEWYDKLITGMGFGFGYKWQSLSTDVGMRDLGAVGQVWGLTLTWN